MLHSSFAHRFAGVFLDFFGPTYFGKLSHLLLQDFFVGLFFYFFLLMTVALYFVGKILGASVLILQTDCFNVGQLLFWVISYEAWVRFGIRVRVRDSAIFEKSGCGCGCGCGRTRQLKNY